MIFNDLQLFLKNLHFKVCNCQIWDYLCTIFKHKIIMKNLNYSKMTNEELLKIVDPIINQGMIPLEAVKEANKRKLFKYYKGTFNSNMIF